MQPVAAPRQEPTGASPRYATANSAVPAGPHRLKRPTRTSHRLSGMVTNGWWYIIRQQVLKACVRTSRAGSAEVRARTIDKRTHASLRFRNVIHRLAPQVKLGSESRVAATSVPGGVMW